MKPAEPQLHNPKTGIIAEKFIPDHVLIYVAAGTLKCFDAARSYTFSKGECFIARRNRLVRYKIDTGKEGFEPTAFCFEEAFLKNYQKKHQPQLKGVTPKDTFINIGETGLLLYFIKSTQPYYTAPDQINKDFEEVKYEELLIILLKQQPELAGLLFDFGKPGKRDLEEFMQKNFTFNVSLKRFAFLTGRSLSAFKRDFFAIFNDTPGHWLVQRRLEEAYFLISGKAQRPCDVYLDLGFEELSHFSAAFKKKFGLTPSELTEHLIKKEAKQELIKKSYH